MFLKTIFDTDDTTWLLIKLIKKLSGVTYFLIYIILKVHSVYTIYNGNFLINCIGKKAVQCLNFIHLNLSNNLILRWSAAALLSMVCVYKYRFRVGFLPTWRHFGWQTSRLDTALASSPINNVLTQGRLGRKLPATIGPQNRFTKLEIVPRFNWSYFFIIQIISLHYMFFLHFTWNIYYIWDLKINSNWFIYIWGIGLTIDRLVDEKRGVYIFVADWLQAWFTYISDGLHN